MLTTVRACQVFLIWSTCSFARAVIKGNLRRSHDVSEAKSGVDYGFENISQLRKTLKPRFENGAWRDVLSWYFTYDETRQLQLVPTPHNEIEWPSVYCATFLKLR